MIKLYIFESADELKAYESRQTITAEKPVVSVPDVTEILGKRKPKRHYKKRKDANPDKEAFKERVLKKAKAGTTGIRHCKNCGKPGHRSDGCPLAKTGLKPRDWDGEEEPELQ